MRRHTSLVIFTALAAAVTRPAAQSPQIGATRIDQLIAQMTLEEKVSMLHGDRDPENLGQAGYVAGIPRLGIPPMRLTDGPAGVRTGKPATALPAPVSMASTFSPELARQYGRIIGRDGAALRQDIILAPMVNIVRVPQAGRNFETLGEDPFLASRLVEAEIQGIEGEGLIATIKHFALNNQENARQSVSADADERTMHEIELPGFEAAVQAGVGAVMNSYNRVNGTYASENPMLETDILRTMWGFTGFVMSDWGATHSSVPAITAGMELEMPGGTNFSKLVAAVKAGELPEATVDRAVRRILVQMDRKGWLDPARTPRVGGAIPVVSAEARDIAIAGAVLLKNDKNILPLGAEDLGRLVVIGPTAKALLVGGGGSARVPPMHLGNTFDELRKRRPSAAITYAVGYDLDGDPIPAVALTPKDPAAARGPIDFTGSKALPAGSTFTWTGTITAPVAGDYEIRLQTAGGRGSIQFVAAADATAASQGRGAAAPAGGGRGGRGGGGGGGLLPTALGLANSMSTARFEASVPRAVTITGTAGAATPLEIRLAWIPPGWREAKIKEAADAARGARAAVVFAYDEGSEGRDRASVALPGVQDALIQAVAAANPRTVIVLNNGAPITMPWANDVAAILQMWYPGQEGADATSAILAGDAAPGGRLPVTFPRRLEDTPTNAPERYPGVDGHGAYSEGIFVGYRWYDHENIDPLYPFGHGLSYTTFTYSDIGAKAAGDGYDVSFTIRNAGTREGVEVPQVYVGPPPAPPVPMAVRSLAGFERVVLAPGASRRVTIHVGARALSYWSVTSHRWELATGPRTIFVGASSRDIRLRADVK